MKNIYNYSTLVCIKYAHLLQINSIQYEKIKEIIISCSNYISINFFDENLLMIIIYHKQDLINKENLLLKLQQFTFDYTLSFSLVFDKKNPNFNKKNYKSQNCNILIYHI
ncbi:hypothetical protein pb186bvf_001694 [Paramecium bursaria]